MNLNVGDKVKILFKGSIIKCTVEIIYQNGTFMAKSGNEVILTNTTYIVREEN